MITHGAPFMPDCLRRYGTNHTVVVRTSSKVDPDALWVHGESLRLYARMHLDDRVGRAQLGHSNCRRRASEADTNRRPEAVALAAAWPLGDGELVLRPPPARAV